MGANLWVAYKKCVGCGHEMKGIPLASDRQAHDECGGKPHFDARAELRRRITTQALDRISRL